MFIFLLLITFSSAITIKDHNILFDFNDQIPSVTIARDDYPGFKFIFTLKSIAEITPDHQIVYLGDFTQMSYSVNNETKQLGVKYVTANEKFSFECNFRLYDNIDPSALSPWLTIGRFNFSETNNSVALTGQYQVLSNGVDISQYNLWTGQQLGYSKLFSLTSSYTMGLFFDNYYSCDMGLCGENGIFTFNYTANTATFTMPGSFRGWNTHNVIMTPFCFDPDYNYAIPTQPPSPPDNPTAPSPEKAAIIGLGTSASFLFILIVTLLICYYYKIAIEWFSCIIIFLLVLIIGTSFGLGMAYIEPLNH